MKTGSSTSEARIVRLLSDELVSRKNRNPGYSLRSFSRSLGIPAPVLSQVLSGKRRVTFAIAQKVLAHFDLDSKSHEKLLNGVSEKKREPGDKKSENVLEATELSAAEFSALSDWWNFAVLALIDSGVRITGPADLKKYFKLSLQRRSNALQNLQTLGLIRKEEKIFVSTGKVFTTSRDLPNAWIRQHHAQGLTLAREKLESTPVSLRDFSSGTMHCDRASIPAIKNKIETFRRSLISEMKSSGGDSVYRIQVQLFPLTEEKI